MYNVFYSKVSKKTLETYDKKTALRIIKGIEEIPFGDIKKLEGEEYTCIV